MTTDAVMLVGAVAAAALGSGSADLPPAPLAWPVAFSALTLVLLAYRGMYGRHQRSQFLDEVRLVVTGTAVATMAVISLRVLLTDNPHTAAQTVELWVLAAGFLSLGRAGLFWARIRTVRRGGGERTLIVGAGEVGHLVARRLLQHPEFGLRPVGFLDNEPLEMNGNGVPLPVLGASWDFERVVAERGVRHVAFTFSTAPHGVMLGLVKRCRELGITVSLVPRLYEAAPERVSIEHLGGLPLVRLHPADPKSWQFAAKYALDRVLAAGALLLVLPLLAVVAVAVRLTMGSPVLFRQRRVGLDGREFDILKFRTMREARPGELVDAASARTTDTGPGGVEGPDRRTRLGALLRRSSIDELPQLINVLSGKMSVVGPRPERPEFATAFSEAVHRYADRHRVKSGITGWAQVHGLNGKTSIADRAEWDNYYIENWSLWLDLKILLRTPAAVLRGHDEP